MTYIRFAWTDKSSTFSCMPNRFQIALWSRSAGKSVETYEKWSFSGIFSRLGVSSRFWAIQGVTYIKIAWNDKNMACDCMPGGFYFAFQSRSAGRRAQTNEKWSL